MHYNSNIVLFSSIHLHMVDRTYFLGSAPSQNSTKKAVKGFKKDINPVRLRGVQDETIAKNF